MSEDQARVLLVADHGLNLLLLMDMLQELDVKPITAESGAKALESFSGHLFA